MQLTPIYNLDSTQHEEHAAIWDALKQKYGIDGKIDQHDLFGLYFTERSGGTLIHIGQIKDGIELNELELAMICNNGFSYFGGWSHIYPDRTFRVEIYTEGI